MAAAENKPLQKLPASGRLNKAVATAGAAVAVTAGLMAVLSGLGTRTGIWDYRFGFTVLRYGAYGGAAAVLLSAAGAVLTFKSRQYLFLLLSLIAFSAGAMTVSVPLFWKLRAGGVPAIHDITTDITNPPQFVAVTPLRKGAANPAEYGGPEIAIRQRQAYPDLKTMILELPQEQAFALALDAAHKLGWEIVASVPAEGRIEATDRTAWFGFRDDIVVRVVTAGNRSLVDVRSLSRVGVSDIGTNARRIRVFMKKLEGRQ